MKKVFFGFLVFCSVLFGLSASENAKEKGDLSFKTDFGSFRSVRVKVYTAEEFVKFNCNVSYIFSDYYDSTKYDYPVYLQLIKKGEFPIENLSLWGKSAQGVVSDEKFGGIYKYDVPKEDSSLDPNNAGESGGTYDILLASDKYVYEISIYPKFTFYDFAKDYPKYFMFRDHGLNGPNYYWKDFNLFINDMLKKKKGLPKSVLDFQNDVEAFIASIKAEK